MKLSRFLFGLLLLVLALLALEYMLAPRGESDSMVRLGRAIGGVAGALLWGIVLWGIVRLIRGREGSPDIRMVSLYTAAGLVTVFVGIRAYQYEDVKANDQAALISGIERECLSSQRESVHNKEIGNSVLKQYCSCIAGVLSVDLAESELRYVAEKGSISDEFKRRMRHASSVCYERVRSEIESD